MSCRSPAAPEAPDLAWRRRHRRRLRRRRPRGFQLAERRAHRARRASVRDRPDAAFPERLPIPMGNDADVSPDHRFDRLCGHAAGMFAALTQWKGYRGGTASRIAIMSFADHSAAQGSAAAGSQQRLNPMWIGGKLYFDSDRNGEFNLYSFDPATGRGQQLTFYRRLSGRERQCRRRQRSSSSRPAACTCSIRRPRPTRRCTSRRNSDLRETRPRRVSNADYVRNVSRLARLRNIALEYRGEIVTRAGEERRAFRNLTQSPGANDRAPAWSPSGSKIAWFSDADPATTRSTCAIATAPRQAAQDRDRVAAPASIAI